MARIEAYFLWSRNVKEAILSGQEFCAADGANYPKWSSWDALRWKLYPTALGGGFQYLSNYKDAWILYNRLRIGSVANQESIPPILLASVAWAEVGGKPDSSKLPAFLLRTFDWSGSDWMDRNLTLTNSPDATSFGAVSIQLRAATKELGIKAESLSLGGQLSVITCLETDLFNLQIVAKHLRGLILYDYPRINTAKLTEEQFIVAGARYNRGTARALSEIQASIKSTPGVAGREYSSYGRAMVLHKLHVQELLDRSVR